MICTIEGVGLWGSGFCHWNQFLEGCHEQAAQNAIPDGSTALAPPLPAAGPKPEVIPARERRRAPLAVKLAVEVASQAFENTTLEAATTACVFGSGMGDTSITDHMCRAVATADKLLSPTKFHNSVHNAAAGYWSISTNCTMPVNSVSSFRLTASVTLLEAVTQCIVQNRSVLMVVFDIKTPAALIGSMTIEEDFASALLLSPGAVNGTDNPQIEIHCGRPSHGQTSEMQPAPQNNPAAALLPLLRGIASGRDQSLEFSVGTASCLQVQLSHATSKRKQASA